MPPPLIQSWALFCRLLVPVFAAGDGGVSPNLITGTNWALVFQTEQQMFFRLSASP
jgi:hypothetical protein